MYWVVAQVRERKRSLDACVGYAKRHSLFPRNEMISTRTLYHEAWAGNLPIGIIELPEAIKRKHAQTSKPRENRKKYGKALICGLYKLLRRIDENPIKLPNPKYVPKPYEKMQYPGQRVQIDVKYVPSVCLVGEAAEKAKENGGYCYQYTFIDEYSRFRYLEAFKEHSTYSSTVFLKHVVKKFPYLIECVQTDNGPEFTNEMGTCKGNKPTLFEMTLEKLCIRHKKIRPYTPRHNGKVERSHRKDNEEFYASHTFYSFDDYVKQLAIRERQYNNFPMRPLNWKSPKEILFAFPNV